MKKSILRALVVSCLIVATGIVRAATVTWANTNSGNWNVATNWIPAQVPASGDDVIITNAGTYSVTNAPGVTLNKLILGGTNGIQTLNLTSMTLTNAGIVNSNGVLNWSGGDLVGALTILQGGTLSISNTMYFDEAPPYNGNAALTNYGTVIWAGNIASYANEASLGGSATIDNAGLWESVGDNSISLETTSTNLFVNTGTLEKIGGTGTSTINWGFTSSGIIQTTSGSFNLNWNGPSTLNGNLTLSGTITSPLIVASNAVLNLSSGDLVSSLTVLQGGILSISNTMYFDEISPYTNNAALTNYGTVIWAGNIASYANEGGLGGSATIDNAGLWESVGDNSISVQASGATNTFINTGTLEKTSGTGASTIGWSFINNSGTVNTLTGSFSMGNWIDSGLVHGNATFSSGTIAGTLASDAMMNFSATINAALTISSNAVANWNGGDLESSLTVLQGGTLSISNQMYFDEISPYTNNAALTNYGTVIWAGNIASYANEGGLGGSATIDNAGLWESVGDNSISLETTSTNLFVNTGTLEKIGGTGASTINWNFASTGTIDTSSGAFNLDWNGPSTLHGNLTLAGSTLTSPLIVASNAVLNLSGGDLVSSLTVLQGGTLSISNTMYFDEVSPYTNNAALTNYGTVIWAGNITSYANEGGLGGSATIDNAGLWESVGDNSISVGASGGTNTFINTGTLEKIGGTSTSTINWNFDSEGGTLETPVGSFSMGNWNGNNLVYGNASVSGSIGGIIGSNAVVNWVGGDLEGTLTVAQGGTLSISNAVYFDEAHSPYTNNPALTNYGTVIWAATITSYANEGGLGGSATIDNAGLWESVGDNSISLATTSTNTFINTGTLEKIGGTGTSTINWNFASTGTIDTFSGAFNLDWNGPSTLHGNLTLAVSTLTSPLIVASNAVLNLSGGDLVSSLTVLQGGTLSISNTVYFDEVSPYTNNAALTNYGTVIWAGAITSYANGDSLGGSATIDNAGLWEAVGDNTISLLTTSTNLFINTGTLEKIGGTSTSTIGWNFLNPGGIVGSQTNILSLTGNYDLTGGTLNFGINSLTGFGKIHLSGSPATLTGSVSANLNYGYVPVTGSSFPVLTYGAENGTFTNLMSPFAIALGSSYGGTTFTLTVLNIRPVLGTPANQVIDELTPLIVGNPGTDMDGGQTLTYSLLNAPAGAAINSSGTVSWIPSEAQGPATNVLTTVVTDNGTPSLSATNSFTVVINEVNVPPVLTLPINLTINELAGYSANATATDSDIPANPLTFALVSGPGGLTVSPTGAISWTPGEAQGPGIYTVSIKVFDTNSAAVNTKSFSVTNSYQITVNEVNSAPAITLPATQTINELTALNVTATASDSDIPANTLTFALVSGPSGLSVAANGHITWTPTEAQGPSTNTVTVKVTDNGSPNLSDTKSFTVVVNEVNTAPVLTLPANVSINEQSSYSANATATDSDIPANPLTFALVSGPSGLTVSSSGAIAWTPTEAQGPGTNTVTISVTDTNPPAVNAKSLSVTNSYQIIVNEVNSAPVLGTLSSYTVNPGQTISFTATATDSDIPANTLTFSLVSPPAGISLNSASGLFNWRPTVAQANTTNTVQIRVTDNGVPPLSDTKSFTVVINPLAPVVLTSLGYTNGQFKLKVDGTSGPDYIIMTSGNLINWTDLATNLSPTLPLQYTDTNALSFTNHFYRVRLSP
ncbi:MAG TPA: putative Ig domain-containing protein [Verrucomicrobiae bacterium]